MAGAFFALLCLVAGAFCYGVPPLRKALAASDMMLPTLTQRMLGFDIGLCLLFWPSVVALLLWAVERLDLWPRALRPIRDEAGSQLAALPALSGLRRLLALGIAALLAFAALAAYSFYIPYRACCAQVH